MRKSEEPMRASVAEMLLDHSVELTDAEAALLVGEVDKYLERVGEQAEENHFIDMNLVVQIADACKSLLARYGNYDKHIRAQIVGAVEYFIDENDVEDDLLSVVGFEDDAEVVNYVIVLTGADIPRIQLDS